MAKSRMKPARGLQARESAPEYGGLAPAESLELPPIYHVTVTDRGRLVLPAELRDRLKIRDGDQVSLTLESDGRVTLQTRDVAIGRMRGMFKHLLRPGERATDRLIAERRRQAAVEDREFRERTAAVRGRRRGRL